MITPLAEIRRGWPLAAKVPLAVAGLMIVVGVIASQRVLASLEETHAKFIDDLSQSYLEGLTSALGPSVLREDSWEVFDAIERAQASYKVLRPTETVVTNADSRVIAASDPRRHPIGSEFLADGGNGRIRFGADGATATVSRELAYPGRTAGQIFASFDTSGLADDRHSLTLALLITNGFLVLALAAAGWLLTRKMMRPLRVLSDHLGAARANRAEQIPTSTIEATQGEFRNLFQAYNALVRSLDDRRRLAERLAKERRISSLGRLASSVAHEINNPLGGLFNAVATLKSHGYLPSVRLNSLGLLDRGLHAIRDTVRTMLSVYRNEQNSRSFEPNDIDDLALLVAPAAKAKGVTLEVESAVDLSLDVASTPVRQAVLNLLLNAVAATPAVGTVRLEACVTDGRLMLAVHDGGEGMPQWAVSILTASTSLPTMDRGGLGLWATSRFIADLGGRIVVSGRPCGGTTVCIEIPCHPKENADAA